MASTSCVRLLSAITVGSLRTMPRPRAYTRVLAVPRSMARSLARPALPLVVLGWLRRQRLQLARELAHPGFHRVRLAAAQPQDERPHQAQQHGDAEVDEVRHDATSTSPARTTSWAATLHSAPPAQLSRFHIGTVVFSASMQNRAASNASDRWGADTATTTEHSATSSSPIRCSSATRPTSGTRARPSAAMAARRGTTCSSYASVSTRPPRHGFFEQRPWALALLSGLVGAMLASGLVVALGIDRRHPVTERVLERNTSGTTSDDAVVSVMERVRPAIVQVVAQHPDSALAGSGFLFRDDGYLLTDERLVAGATSLQV